MRASNQNSGKTKAERSAALVIAAIALSVTSGNIMAQGSSLQEAEMKAVSHRVTISDFEFKPSTLTVSQGDRITWVNLDIAPHNVTISSSQNKLSPNLKTNEEYSLTIDANFDYECGLHPPMKGKIVVK